MTLGTFAPSPVRTAHPLAADIRSVVVTHERTRPRSLQRALGPSEVGDQCARKLAYKMLHHTVSNEDSDPWAAIIGTATHAWLADAFLAANMRLGRIRYLVETAVTVRPGLSGSCDLYDVDVATVIDHKIVGTTSMREYKAHGPRPAYRVQAHLYGAGFINLGLPVERVALAFYPRGGLLSGLYIWDEPYDPDVATAALARQDQILEAACALDVEHHPENYKHLPRSAGHACTYCPFWAPGPDTGNGCPGHLSGTDVRR